MGNKGGEIRHKQQKEMSLCRGLRAQQGRPLSRRLSAEDQMILLVGLFQRFIMYK